LENLLVHGQETAAPETDIRGKKGENDMAETKYGKHITRDCVFPGRTGKVIFGTRDLDWFGRSNLSVECIYITSPRLMITQPHQHEFPQYLCFSSSNPEDPNDFDAEIEMTLGEEGEKHIIKSPAVAYIPAGLPHGPLNFTKINKPVLFVDIALSAEYTRVGNTED
jgi:hypothetical protein